MSTLPMVSGFLQTKMAEGSQRKNYLKGNILLGLPTPSLEAYPDNKFTVIASVCCGQQIMQELLSRKVNRAVWQKVRSREFCKTC